MAAASRLSKRNFMLCGWGLLTVGSYSPGHAGLVAPKRALFAQGFALLFGFRRHGLNKQNGSAALVAIGLWKAKKFGACHNGYF